jgi:hypothetical protein
MDLNVDNYTISDLINTFNLSEDNLDLKNLDSGLSDKMNQIKIIDEDLPEKKEDLMDFYTKAYLKIKESFNTKRETQEINNFEKSVGNTFDYDLNPEEFINVREKLLPIIQNGPTVQQNNSFVTKHNDLPALNTFNSNLRYGDVNPLTRKSFKKILNINTKFRNNYTTTVSTNFTMQLPSTIKKVVSIKLVDTQFPEMVYTVSNKLGSNSFILDTALPGGPYTIDISNGSYNNVTIVDTINAHPYMILNNVELSYDETNGLMTFTQLGGIDMSLNFNYVEGACPQLPSNIYKDQLTLGWLLGFRGNYLKPIPSTLSPFTCLNLVKDQQNISNIYSGSSSYTGESLFDPHGSRYFFVSINDYNNNHNSNFISPFQYQTVSDNNIIAKISTDCCKSCCVEQPDRIYFGPTDITKLEIKIYDEFGRIVDINNADYSFTLELELVYDL